MHHPEFLGNYEWITLGRIRPVHLNTVVYGPRSSMVPNGTTLWLEARLSRDPTGSIARSHRNSDHLERGFQGKRIASPGIRQALSGWNFRHRLLGIFGFVLLVIFIRVTMLEDVQ